MPTKTDILKAINVVQESRHTHAQWQEWLIKALNCGCVECRAWIDKSVPYAGDLERHRTQIEKYDHVLAVLKAMT